MDDVFRFLALWGLLMIGAGCWLTAIGLTGWMKSPPGQRCRWCDVRHADPDPRDYRAVARIRRVR